MNIFNKRRIIKLVGKVQEFVDENYYVPRPDIVYSDRSYGKPKVEENYNAHSVNKAVKSLDKAGSPSDVLHTIEENTNAGFVKKMLEYIDNKHMRDVDVYKAAHVDRRLFSKMVSDFSYKPSKDTCISLALALQLSLSEANDLLSRAGYILSHSNKRDIVIEYFFREGIYNLNDINNVLFQLYLCTLG